MITIVIVEDQGILRESLACTINLQEDMQVARALSDAADALDVVRETNANLALLDVCTENGSSGIAAAKQIREACPSDASALNETEISILRLVCEAKTRKEIAAELYLSEDTVKRHISEILAKTGYDSILRLAVHAVSQGLIVPKMDK